MTVPTEAGAEAPTQAPEATPAAQPSVPSSLVSDPIYLQDLVAVVVDQVDGDPATVGARERA
jgi:hypothetical protein